LQQDSCNWAVVIPRQRRICAPAQRRLRIPGMLTLINPIPRAEPFDHADWLFELKFDGFRAAADTVRGRLVSRNGDRLRRFEGVLELLLRGCVFDGELVVLDDAGRPLFNALMFGRRRPTYVAFDLLMAGGEDLRLVRVGKGAERWIALTNGVVGDGRALYRAVVNADLEGIVAKRLADAYEPKRARWHKVLNWGYSQHSGRAEWFRERRER
jgi:bifunctional non-homologous end joining protein LigD